ncbi:Polygalacturonase QRT3 [Acorus gramineus]|uniref:Polygalacturonase QRT3 n=1 Tax=Acorus gramineus TaxID=55184 RepID=A0AAV9BVC0_ACOGR|nr:Polygalacturonase QRT3 [Acorus gramineus]
MTRSAAVLSLVLAMTTLFASGDPFPNNPHRFLKSSLIRRLESTTRSGSGRVYHAMDYGADPTGKNDSTDALMRAISDAFRPPDEGRFLISGIVDLGGAQLDLDGGAYLLSRPLRLPSSGGGNFKIHSGSLRASDNFPKDGYLIELQPTAHQSGPQFASSYEYVTLQNLLIDANYVAGGILIVDSLRTTVDTCYITRFASDGIAVVGGHETYIHNTFLGQHITAGADPGERSFSGTAINIRGNDNAVTDVVIFSAAVGVMISGQANVLTGVHCYNKATGFGGTGIYLKSPGLTQTRILNCYLDYTGIVAEDPVQLLISGTFFLGNAFVKLKSVNGVMKGVTIVDNMFSGDDSASGIVQLDESGGRFVTVERVVVERNDVSGMGDRSTVGRGSVTGNGTLWAVDLSGVLLFPDKVRNVQYAVQVGRGGGIVGHAVRNVSGNVVVVESDAPVEATVHVLVDQS